MLVATYKTPGLVLRRSNLGEADRLITFLTPEYGKLRAVARGVRKIKSRLGGHLELFGEVELLLAEGKSLDVVAGARLLRPAADLVSRPAGLELAYLTAEMVDRLVGERHGSAGLYALLRETLAELAEDADELTQLRFKLLYLRELGYEPVLSRCAVCQQPLQPGADYSFEVAAGGAADRTCASLTSASMRASEIKLWRLLLRSTPATARGTAGTLEAAVSSLPLVDGFYEHLFGKRFRAQQLLGTLL